MKTRKMTQNPTRNNRKKKKNNPEKICKTNESFVMAVGKKKKERNWQKIDDNKQIYLNLPPKTKRKEKKLVKPLCCWHILTRKYSPALFFFSCDRRLEIPNWSAQNTTVQQLFERKKRKKYEKNITKHWIKLSLPLWSHTKNKKKIVCFFFSANHTYNIFPSSKNKKL